MRTTLIICAVILVSCARKSIPEATPIIIKNDCDSLITAALENIEYISFSDSACEDLAFRLASDNIKLSESISTLKKEILQCSVLLHKVSTPTVFIDRSKTKTKVSKSYNDIEVYKLKHSLLMKSDSIAELYAENIALSGKIKDLDKMKNSTTGDSSPNSLRSGNTTSRSPWYTFLIVFIAGGITSQAIRLIIKNAL